MNRAQLCAPERFQRAPVAELFRTPLISRLKPWSGVWPRGWCGRSSPPRPTRTGRWRSARRPPRCWFAGDQDPARPRPEPSRQDQRSIVDVSVDPFEVGGTGLGDDLGRLQIRDRQHVEHQASLGESGQPGYLSHDRHARSVLSTDLARSVTRAQPPTSAGRENCHLTEMRSPDRRREPRGLVVTSEVRDSHLIDAADTATTAGAGRTRGPSTGEPPT